MFPDRYLKSGLGERLGCTLNLGHPFEAIEASFNLLCVDIRSSSASWGGMGLPRRRAPRRRRHHAFHLADVSDAEARVCGHTIAPDQHDPFVPASSGHGSTRTSSSA